MSDSTFQSGPWTGFYVYASRIGGRHRMNMVLTFAASGALEGSGSDGIGRFKIQGRFDPKAKEATWTKQYVGGHAVSYRGYRDAMKKAVWGIWEIGKAATGGFKIWPVGSGAEDGEVETQAEPKPILKVAGQPAPVGGLTPHDSKPLTQQNNHSVAFTKGADHE